MPNLETNSSTGPGSPVVANTARGRARNGERKRWRILQNRIERARDLRRAGNRAEQIIWDLLRARPADSYRFRRQYPIGPYFVDFACVARKLVVEISADHTAPEQATAAGRMRRLKQEGWRVVRLEAHRVIDDPAAALTEIERALDAF
jgi:very-short-patch-repair endonuclease